MKIFLCLTGFEHDGEPCFHVDHRKDCIPNNWPIIKEIDIKTDLHSNKELVEIWNTHQEKIKQKKITELKEQLSALEC